MRKVACIALLSLAVAFSRPAEAQASGAFWSSLAKVLEKQRARDAEKRASDAEVKLFTSRARFVVQNAIDSIGLWDKTADRFWKEATAVMSNLWIIDQQAPNAKMIEALAPIRSDYARRKKLFIQAAGNAMWIVADSLHFDSLTTQAFAAVGSDHLNRLMGQDIDAPIATMFSVLRAPTDSFIAARRLTP